MLACFVRGSTPDRCSLINYDRGYLDFQRLYRLTLSAAFFVIRTKENVLLQRRYSKPVDQATGLRSDQTVILTTVGSATAYPDALRRISYVDAETNKHLVFLTNNFILPALTIAQIYKCRWQVELFFENSTWCTPSDVIDSPAAVALDRPLVGLLPNCAEPNIA